MTSFTDFTDLGFFPLQDHAAAQDGTPVSRRMMLAGGRIIQMKDPGDAANADEALIRYGREAGLGTLGDVHPWMFWQTRERAVRGMGSWAQSFASIAVDADPYYAKINAQPLRDRAFYNDTRYRPMDAAWPAGMSRVPRGALLTILPGTEESSQQALAMWSDPRLIAPAANGPGECGTLVADLGPSREICMGGSDRPGIDGRHARLQTLLRVIAVQPGRGFADLGAEGNTLALNFSTSGQDGIPNFGAFWARTSGGGAGPITGGPNAPTTGGGGPTTGGPITGVPSGGAGGDGPERSTFGTLRVGGGAFGAEVAAGEDEKQPKDYGQWGRSFVGDHAIGLMSNVGGDGPLHPGSPNDKHRHGVDRDGHPINAGHISTGAYFYENQNRDAPISFEGAYPNPLPLPIPAPAHLSYDGASFHGFSKGMRGGLWRFWCETPDVQPVPPDDPTNKPIPPVQIPPTTGRPIPPVQIPPTGGPPTGGPGGGSGGGRGPGDTVPPPPTYGRPITPNPGGKRFPNKPTTPPTHPGGPSGPGTGGGTPQGPTTPGGGGGQPSVPCKVQPLTPGPQQGPITGGPRLPSASVPAGPGAQPVWTPGGRGSGGGGGTVPPQPGGGENRSTQTNVMPTGAAIFGTGGSNILPVSGGMAGRGSSGTTGTDVRQHLMRLSGRNPFTNEPQTVAGVNERIGSATREENQLYTLFRPMAQGFASINFRPQLTINGFPNFEHNPQMPAAMYFNDERERPQVLTMRAFGAQSTADSDWSYVQRPEDSRARGGTGDGGILLAPPRFELSDYYGIGSDVMDVSDTTSAQATTHYVMHAPGVSTAYGLPTQAGGLQTGGATLGQISTQKPLGGSVQTAAGVSSTAFSVNYHAASGDVQFQMDGTGSMQLPAGTTGERPTNLLAAGSIRWNSTTGSTEVYDGSSWSAVGGATGDITTSGLTMSANRLLGNDNATGSGLPIEEIEVNSSQMSLSAGTLSIKDAAITPVQIQTQAVTTGKIATSAVTTDKIAFDLNDSVLVTHVTNTGSVTAVALRHGGQTLSTTEPGVPIDRSCTSNSAVVTWRADTAPAGTWTLTLKKKASGSRNYTTAATMSVTVS